MDKSAWERLVERHLPLVELSRTSPNKDDYMPSSIDWFLERSTLLDHEDSSVRIVAPTRADLAANPQETRYLKADDDSVYLGDPKTAAMYAHIRKATPPTPADLDWIDIQYWFFYPFSGPIGGPYPLSLGGAHQGDWEHVTVRVSDWRSSGTSVVEAVFFAAHRRFEGRWLVLRSSSPKPDRFALENGTHPFVFSAWHSHASYESKGLHKRSVGHYFFVNDYCSGGHRWGPDAAYEILQIDDDVYQAGDDRIPPPGWAAFTGRWGNSGVGSPRTPPQQGMWNDDGQNGFYIDLEPLASFGSAWSEKRGTTAVALGLLGHHQVLAVGRNMGDNNRYYIFRCAANQLTQVAEGGDSWAHDRGVTGIALGIFAGKQTLGVSRGGDEKSRFLLFHWHAGKLAELENGGDGWGSGRYATCIAFGVLDDLAVVGVGRNEGNHERFFIYRWLHHKLEILARGGNTWDGNRGTTAIAFGLLDDRWVVGVGRNRGGGARFEIYTWVDGQLIRFGSGGESWSSDCKANGIAFGLLADEQVVGVTRDAGDGPRFYVYHWTDSGLTPLVDDGGKDWGKEHRATGIAFGVINGIPYLAVSRTGSHNARVILYGYEDGKLVQRGAAGNTWGDDRDATCAAVGELGGKPVIAYGRNPGGNHRGGVLKWIT
ncbi:MAG TPA: Vps62-related protein [Thermoanaerobaculia bacterium]|jgi:hypothetical protein|nr:Vps62-related protein [Thermoanaerobaculia bacterium]